MHKLVKKVKFQQSVKGFFRRVIQLPLAINSETERFKSVYELVWAEIKQGLDFGYGVKCNTFDGEVYASMSLESIYKDYFGRSGTDHELAIIYTALTTELLPNYISSYDKNKQLEELTTGENEYGYFFEIKFKDEPSIIGNMDWADEIKSK